MISSVSSSYLMLIWNTSAKRKRESSASEEAKEIPAQEAAETKSKSSNKINTYA